MSRSISFYTQTLGLKCVQATERIAVFPLGAGVLLLFQLGLTGDDTAMPDEQGTIPKHGPTEPLLPYVKDSTAGTDDDASGPAGLTIGGERLRQHFCFAVETAADVDGWDAHLVGLGTEILGRVRWPDERGRSVYFADPDGNVGEVASKGIWRHLMSGG